MESNQLPHHAALRIPFFQQAKKDGQRFAMLTSYDAMSAKIFDAAGIEALLVGDSAANTIYGYDTTVPVTVDELLPLCRAVTSTTRRALVVADAPFGSYEVSAEQAVTTGIRFLKEGRVSAVKIEFSATFVPQVRSMVAAGIPVMAHIGLTPQRIHQLGGYRVQGLGDDGRTIMEQAKAAEEAGAFCVVLEMVPAPVAARVEAALQIPTIGIGAGPDTTGQVLVWQDMAGFTLGPVPSFVTQYAQLGQALHEAASAFGADVRQRRFPASAVSETSEHRRL